MSFELSIHNNASLIQKQAVDEILRSNDITMRYGLMLSEKQAVALAETRTMALKENGRIEFGGGVIDKLIYAFCDSPYISQYNYEETMHELLETFYYYKNETLDSVSDDALIQYMKRAFDGICEGSTELLTGSILDSFARAVRSGATEIELKKTYRKNKRRYKYDSDEYDGESEEEECGE